jgi:hypothetical protein
MPSLRPCECNSLPARALGERFLLHTSAIKQQALQQRVAKEVGDRLGKSILTAGGFRELNYQQGTSPAAVEGKEERFVREHTCRKIQLCPLDCPEA